MNFKSLVAELLQVALDENPSLFLIELKIGADNSIRILIDGDEGVKLESCIAVSRQIEYNIDREEFDFSLEVSSPRLKVLFCSVQIQYTLKQLTFRTKSLNRQLVGQNQKRCVLQFVLQHRLQLLLHPNRV